MIDALTSLSQVSLPMDTVLLLGQLADPGIDTPEEAALVFSGPQFFIALLSGLILAFGFQLLLTNLSVAAGISYLGHSGSSSSSSSSSSNGSGVRKIGIAFGVWTLVTVSLALFFACLLAVKLSLYNSPLMGAITGLVIWGTYFCLLFWVSSTTVGSLIGSVVKTATSSFQTLVGTATAAMGAKAVSNQTVQTAEAAAAAIRRELTAAWDGDSIADSLKDYLTQLRSPELDTAKLEAEFERMLASSDAIATADAEILNQVDRQAFAQLLSDRTDLSQQEVNRLADRLYHRWQGTVTGKSGGMDALLEYVRSADPKQVVSEELGQRLDAFLDEYRRQNRRGQKQKQSSLKSSVSKGLSQGLTQGLNTVMSVAMGRTDLSDLDIDKIRRQVKQAQSDVTSQVASLTSDSPNEPDSIIKSDVDDYLLNNYVWQYPLERLEKEFAAVLYDPEASILVLKRALATLNRPYFTKLLKSRGLLTQDEIRETSLRLETVRQKVLAEVTEAYRLESVKTLQAKVDTFLRYTPRDELLSDTMGTDAFQALVEDEEADSIDLEDRFVPFGHAYFQQKLNMREDIIGSEADEIAKKLDRVMQQVLADAKGLQSSVRVRADQQWQDVQNYLRNTGKAELDPAGIKADIQRLMHEPNAGAARLRQRIAQFDRDTLVQLLSQRDDLSEAEVNRVVDDVESSWYEVMQTPARLTAEAQAKVDQANRAITNYLHNTGKPELNPEGIKRDLQLLVNDPKSGFDAIQTRLSQMDHDTLVQLLSQRDDLSEEDVNQVIDDILSSIQSVLRMPRRLALRAQSQAVSFKEALEDYLRSTDKAALNPDGIKRDLELLLNDPKLGGDRLQTRLSMIDRDAVVALLAQRNDMTREDAEAVVGQVMGVRDQMVARLKQVQMQFRAAINRILNGIRRYLDSLDRPELNYYGIKRDVQKLFDDPQAGFDALRMRLSEFDRDTLLALVSSHDAISKSDVNRVIDQVESARDGALRKAEKLEHQVQSRINDLKLQAQQQVDDTRKTAEAASWWLFGTATISAVTAAIAGMIAVGG